MSLTIETTPELEARLREDAARHGMDLGTYTLMLLQQRPAEVSPRRKRPEDLTPEERAAAWARLRRHIGKGHSGDPNAGDNERIDADLAREYGSSHEDQT